MLLYLVAKKEIIAVLAGLPVVGSRKGATLDRVGAFTAVRGSALHGFPQAGVVDQFLESVRHANLYTTKAESPRKEAFLRFQLRSSVPTRFAFVHFDGECPNR